MKLNRLILAAVAAMFVEGAYAQQPYGGCWHPDDIKNWSPETDKDAKFNRSRVPLAKRFKEPTLMKANKNQYYEGQICNAPILFPTCSMCPSQGAYNFLGYQPTYWQYMDKLVYWAGSASEGIIIPPPAGSIDAAHQSGVKVLGQVFFPPYAYGGNQAWVRQMLTKENGVHIYAKKLYEIAKYIGFDGWFINEESGVQHLQNGLTSSKISTSLPTRMAIHRWKFSGTTLVVPRMWKSSRHTRIHHSSSSMVRQATIATMQVSSDAQRRRHSLRYIRVCRWLLQVIPTLSTTSMRLCLQTAT